MRKTTKLLGAIFGILWAVPVWGACYDYTSATGTVVQDGTPTPDNPIEPVFYQQGNMILRAVGDVADSYDATTGKITRRIKETKLTPDGGFGFRIVGDGVCTVMLPVKARTTIMSTHFANDTPGAPSLTATNHISTHSSQDNNVYFRIDGGFATTTDCMNWAQEQINAGTPVMIYSIMPTETEETIGTQWCDKIKIATMKYNESAFSPLNTALANAISVVDTVVSNTITQAGRIATLQAQKQTRPNDIADDSEKCPAGKKCLLVEDASGTPHWYEIVENAWDLPVGYTQLQYIESTGTQYIDTGFSPDANTRVDYKGQLLQFASSVPLLGARLGSDNPGRFFPLAWYTNANAGRIVYGDKDVMFNISTSTIYTGTFIPAQEKTIINGITYDISGANFTKTADNNFYLFATSGYVGNLYNSVGRIWYVKIWDNDTLVRDMVPAKNSSGVVGMYDTVNNRFYTNAGTGEFVAGPVAE